MDNGISALDLLDLPADQRKIMRLMLRKGELSYQALSAALGASPEGHLDAALDALCRQGWLTCSGAEQSALYRANLRRKAGAARGEPAAPVRERIGRQQLWAALDAATGTDTPPPKDEGQAE